MKNEADIKELIKLSIGQIRTLENAQQSINNIVDAQRNSVKEAIKISDVDEEWADNFLKEMGIDDN